MPDADKNNDPSVTVDELFPHNESPSIAQTGLNTAPCGTSCGASLTKFPNTQCRRQGNNESAHAQFTKLEFKGAPIRSTDQVTYLGESLSMDLLVHNTHGTAGAVHYALPEGITGSKTISAGLDAVEMDILRQRGAFLLPPRSLCDALVGSYFEWVAPIIPVINRTQFMKQYQDEGSPPSLLLLQAILLAGTRVCTHPQLMDVNGSTIPAAVTFYNRAKALFDANYEVDRIITIQALVLMGWYCEGPWDNTMDVFYWTRVATLVAQSSGMHRNVEETQLSLANKRLWKRIWWTLFTRDRSVAVALGRQVLINTNDCDIETICPEDFIEGDDSSKKVSPDPLHVQFFLQYVGLCEIMGRVLSQQYSVASRNQREGVTDLDLCDTALMDWLQNCPTEVYWEQRRHNFWSALLHSNYYTTVCLLHRAYIAPATGEKRGQNLCRSRNITFRAAAMITSIVDTLSICNELRYCPGFMVYSLFSALVIHEYQMFSNAPSVVRAIQEQKKICIGAVRDISRVWLAAKIVETLFEPMLATKSSKEVGGGDERRTQNVDREFSQNSHGDTGVVTHHEIELAFSQSIFQLNQPIFEESMNIQTQFPPVPPMPNFDRNLKPIIVLGPSQNDFQASKLLLQTGSLWIDATPVQYDQPQPGSFGYQF